MPLLHHLHTNEVFSEVFPRDTGLSVGNIPFTFCCSSFSSSSRRPSSSDSAPLSLLSAFPFTAFIFGVEFMTLLRSKKTFNKEKVSILKETNTQLPQKYQAAAAQKHFHVKRTINECQFYFCMLFLNYFNVSLSWFTTECLTTHEWFWGSLLEKQYITCYFHNKTSDQDCYPYFWYSSSNVLSRTAMAMFFESKSQYFYRSSPWGWNASKLQTLKHSIQWCEQPDSVKGKCSINLFPQWFKQNMVTKCIQTLIWQSAHGSKDWVQWKKWCNKYTVHLFACPITQILYIYIFI